MSRTATARKPVKVDRRALAEELVGIHKKNASAFARITGLKGVAKDIGASFKEDFAGLGVVKVSCAKEKTFKGNVPEIVPEAFNALPRKEQDQLVKKGLVKIGPAYTGAYYGAVEVELF
jgi:hypothetical protein